MKIILLTLSFLITVPAQAWEFEKLGTIIPFSESSKGWSYYLIILVLGLIITILVLLFWKTAVDRKLKVADASASQHKYRGEINQRLLAQAKSNAKQAALLNNKKILELKGLVKDLQISVIDLDKAHQQTLDQKQQQLVKLASELSALKGPKQNQDGCEDQNSEPRLGIKKPNKYVHFGTGAFELTEEEQELERELEDNIPLLTGYLTCFSDSDYGGHPKDDLEYTYKGFLDNADDHAYGRYKD